VPAGDTGRRPAKSRRSTCRSPTGSLGRNQDRRRRMPDPGWDPLRGTGARPGDDTGHAADRRWAARAQSLVGACAVERARRVWPKARSCRRPGFEVTGSRSTGAPGPELRVDATRVANDHRRVAHGPG
jgi:hypothetical protein